MFIFATTEIHKVPATILSRCQCFTFNKLQHSQVVQLLTKVCKAENIKYDFMIILEHEEVLSFIVTPLNGRNVKTAQMYLTGIPLRPGKSTRIHLELKMLSERKLLVSAIDMGFGEFYEASGLMWNTEIVLE